MDTGTAIVSVGVLISLFGYLEVIRRDLRSEIKEVRQASENMNQETLARLGGEIKDVRQASEASHQETLTRLGGEIKDVRQASEASHQETLTRLSGEIKDVRQASETAHKDIQTRLGNVEVQLATVNERVECIDGKVDLIQQRLDQEPSA